MAAGVRIEDGSLDIIQSIEEDPLLDAQLLPHHSLQAHFRPRFHPLPTVIIANLLLFIHVVFVILAFLTGVLCSYPDPNEDKCPGNYTNPLKVQTVIILGKVILWILHLLLERYIQYHHSKVRNRGYNQIYRATRHLKSLALVTHSTGNTMLLLILCMQHSFPEPSRLYLDLILAILALELLCSLTCLLIYAVKIRKFNRDKPQPDVLEEEKIYAYHSNITSETGLRTISSLEEIVEKQGDIIVYLKRHNALLSKRLLALTCSDLASQPSRT
ncbi:transmembrane protein 192 isoform X1 [Marmota marmota marmota]|uniref:Transmembrane protein 192 n=1 Tax=Marmota marmota marmota TaxID=9994 RepID=A0A8C5ZME2_MARMA|nr:transmembrane protein 192 isoform X1 [Marmota marmota marmota]XP_027782930.1 transmembrane protein 192 [Marmota flaviventris]XP_027807990.1 transmembrane protein 192 [Marmota flaviventris]